MDEWLEKEEKEKNDNTKPPKLNHVMVTGEELDKLEKSMLL